MVATSSQDVSVVATSSHDVSVVATSSHYVSVVAVAGHAAAGGGGAESERGGEGPVPSGRKEVQGFPMQIILAVHSSSWQCSVQLFCAVLGRDQATDLHWNVQNVKDSLCSAREEASNQYLVTECGHGVKRKQMLMAHDLGSHQLN